MAGLLRKKKLLNRISHPDPSSGHLLDPLRQMSSALICLKRRHVCLFTFQLLTMASEIKELVQFLNTSVRVDGNLLIFIVLNLK